MASPVPSTSAIPMPLLGVIRYGPRPRVIPDAQRGKPRRLSA